MSDTYTELAELDRTAEQRWPGLDSQADYLVYFLLLLLLLELVEILYNVLEKLGWLRLSLLPLPLLPLQLFQLLFYMDFYILLILATGWSWGWWLGGCWLRGRGAGVGFQVLSVRSVAVIISWSNSSVMMVVSALLLSRIRTFGSSASWAVLLMSWELLVTCSFFIWTAGNWQDLGRCWVHSRHLGDFLSPPLHLIWS